MKSSKKKTQILIVEDHPITREGLANVIRQTKDLAICGEAENAERSIAMVESLKPDLVIADISLPGRNGIELIKDLRALRPRLPVLVISMHDESLYAERALRAGARGYMMKHEGGDRLIEGIRHVLAGRIWVSTNASSALLEKFSSGPSSISRSSLQKLSDRELEVFHLIGEGISTQQIARRLRVSGKTVETHRMHIKEKLGFETSAQLISFAARSIATDSESR